MGLRAVVAGVSALAVLAVGCGDGSDDATEEVSTVTLDLLAETVEGGTVRFEMTLEEAMPESVPGGADVLSGEASGVLDLASGDNDMTTTVVLGAAPRDGGVDPVVDPVPTTFQVRRIGDRSFGRQTFGAADDAPWVEETGDADGDGVDDDGFEIETDTSGDGLLGDLFDLRDFDPRGALEALREVTDEVTEEGREDVRGEPTTRYRAIVDGEEVGSDVTADGDTPLDVWIDDDGRLRRIEVAGLRLDLFDYGVPVEIEVPTDLGSDEDAESWFGMSQPTPTDEWEVQAEGTSGGSAWAVWAAPHELDGTAFTCRTLELGDDAEGWGGIAPEVDAFMPNHDGVLAACGYSSWFGTPTTNDPSVQVLQTQGMGAVGDPGSLVAFAVDDRWQGGPVRLVRDGADDVVLDVDGSGVAVWQPEGSAPITEVWVGDDAVRCEVVDFEDLMGDAMDASEEPPEEDLPEGELPDELLPDGMAWLTPIYVSACVRA